MQADMAFAFRKNGEVKNLRQIAYFQRLVKNYLDMFIHDAMVINDGKFPVAKYEEYKPTRNLDEFCTSIE